MGLHDDLSDLPSGYGTKIGENGHILSVGQRQKIAIARALATNPKVIMLDEPTSNLDPRSEQLLISTLQGQAKRNSSTIIIITHSPAILAHADSITLLGAGKIQLTGPEKTCCPKSRGPSLPIIRTNPMNKRDENFPVESLLDKYRLKHSSYLSILVILLLVSTFSWMFVSELDEVAVATGEVVPQGQVKLIQHLEGGIVTEILAREGQKVAKGERLMQLRLGADRVRSSEIELQAAGLVIKRDRLQAELTSSVSPSPRTWMPKFGKFFKKKFWPLKIVNSR